MMESTYTYRRTCLFESLETRTRRIVVGQAVEVLGIDGRVAEGRRKLEKGRNKVLGDTAPVSSLAKLNIFFT